MIRPVEDNNIITSAKCSLSRDIRNAHIRHSVGQRSHPPKFESDQLVSAVPLAGQSRGDTCDIICGDDAVAVAVMEDSGSRCAVLRGLHVETCPFVTPPCNDYQESGTLSPL